MVGCEQHAGLQDLRHIYPCNACQPPATQRPSISTTLLQNAPEAAAPTLPLPAAGLRQKRPRVLHLQGLTQGLTRPGRRGPVLALPRPSHSLPAAAGWQHPPAHTAGCRSQHASTNCPHAQPGAVGVRLQTGQDNIKPTVYSAVRRQVEKGPHLWSVWVAAVLLLPVTASALSTLPCPPQKHTHPLPLYPHPPS